MKQQQVIDKIRDPRVTNIGSLGAALVKAAQAKEGGKR